MKKMASYHFSVKCGNHNGRKTSAINHLNYINREGRFKNFDQKNNDKQTNECIYKKNFLPAWAKDSARKFWSNAEKFERVNACVYKELEFNLVNELPLRENLKIINNLLKTEPMNKFYYSLAIHDKQKSAITGERNLHCHLMFCERENDGIERDAKTFFKRYNSKNPASGGAKKSIMLNDRKIGKQTIKNLRDEYAKIVNKILKENNIEQTISSKSLKEQHEEAIKKGDLLKAKILDREPERHLGRKLSKDVNLKKDLLEIRSFNEILSKLNSQKGKNVSPNRYTALQVDNILKNFSQELTKKMNKLQKDLEKMYPKVISEERAKIMAIDIATKGKYKIFRELASKIDKSNSDDINKQYAINANKLKKEIVSYLDKPEVKIYVNKIVNGILEKNLPIKNNYNKLNNNLNKMRLQLHNIGKLRKATGIQIKLDKGKNIAYEVKAKDNLSTGGAGDPNKVNNAKILAEAFAGNVSISSTVIRIADNEYDEFKDSITMNSADKLAQETDNALSL